MDLDNIPQSSKKLMNRVTGAVEKKGYEKELNGEPVTLEVGVGVMNVAHPKDNY